MMQKNTPYGAGTSTGTTVYLVRVHFCATRKLHQEQMLRCFMPLLHYDTVIHLNRVDESNRTSWQLLGILLPHLELVPKLQGVDGKPYQ